MKNRQPSLKVLWDCVTENCWWHLYLCWRNLLLLLYFCSKWAGHQPCCNCSELSICLVLEIQIGHHRSHLFSLIIESDITCQLAALALFLVEPHQPLTSSWLNLSASPEHDFFICCFICKSNFSLQATSSTENVQRKLNTTNNGNGKDFYFSFCKSTKPWL